MKLINNRILIIDDNASIHEDYKKILADRSTPKNASLDSMSKTLFGDDSDEANQDSPDYQLYDSFQGEDAVELIQHQLYDDEPIAVAFVDVRMPPGIDGIETIKRIWEIDPRVQIVLCTAYSDYDWGEIYRILGHSESLLILKKPFESMEVLQMAYSLSTRWELARQVELKADELEEMIKLRTNELQQKTLQHYEAEKLASLGVLAGGVAHEFNNLNASILGFADILLRTNSLPDKEKNYLVRIKASCLRGKDIATNLLTFAGKARFNKKKVVLKELFEAALVVLEKDIKEYSIHVSKDIPSMLCVYVDTSMLIQVLINILKNAIEAMVDSKEKDLSISVQSDSSWVYIKIEDTGCGMDAEVVKSIFNPFFSTKGVYNQGLNSFSKMKGTGLGLSVSQAIMINHNGDISLKSEVNHGTIFTIKIPNIKEEGEL